MQEAMFDEILKKFIFFTELSTSLRPCGPWDVSLVQWFPGMKLSKPKCTLPEEGKKLSNSWNIWNTLDSPVKSGNDKKGQSEVLKKYGKTETLILTKPQLPEKSGKVDKSTKTEKSGQ